MRSRSESRAIANVLVVLALVGLAGFDDRHPVTCPAASESASGWPRCS